MTTLEDIAKLAAVKIAFEAIVDNFKKSVQQLADDIGADITLNVECKVNSVNLEQYNETLAKARAELKVINRYGN